jgi:hypothetical protein
MAAGANFIYPITVPLQKLQRAIYYQNETPTIARPVKRESKKQVKRQPEYAKVADYSGRGLFYGYHGAVPALFFPTAW